MDWPAILTQNRIEYVESGPNVSKNYVAVKCPFCGVSDPSQHMTISRTSSYWKCWRNPSHHGRDPVKLLSSLMRCTYAQAQAILGPEISTPLPDNLLATVQAKLSPPPADDPEVYDLPEEFKKFKDVPSADRFVSYLRRRKFSRSDIWWMSSRYGLRYCTRGDFQGRIIFPVVYQDQLLGWTGRSIYPGERLRYKTEGALTSQLLWYDDILKDSEWANTIVLCEGPFDALKVSVLGHYRGIVSTCFFTSSLSDGQLDRLYDLLPLYRHRYLILDRGAVGATLRAAKRLRALSVETRWLPEGIKDPGVLTKQGLYRLVGA